MVAAKIKTEKKWYQKNTTVSFRFIGTTEVTVADYIKEFERVSGNRGFYYKDEETGVHPLFKLPSNVEIATLLDTGGHQFFYTMPYITAGCATNIEEVGKKIMDAVVESAVLTYRFGETIATVTFKVRGGVVTTVDAFCINGEELFRRIVSTDDII
jgi:hypothetical protein